MGVYWKCIVYIYINDLPGTLEKKDRDVTVYADDTNIIPSSSDVPTVVGRAGDTLGNVQNWCLNNRIHLNVEKTELVYEEEKWNDEISYDNVEIATNTVLSKLSSMIKDSTEEKTVNYKENRKSKAWISNGIINSIKLRDEMKEKLLRNYNKDDEVKYKQYRNTLDKLVQKCKHDFYKQKISECRGDHSKVYQTYLKEPTRQIAGKIM
ncbi:hypothetical protein HHI36_004160 [Cryptolaemus montrouzieri]|uniref:Reverse transcriptase domain-containing protein n=1 Tax=Cryptolaemus montrouzieri TaxID=559131 RepID=A0ABD2NQD6_9CUCU